MLMWNHLKQSFIAVFLRIAYSKLVEAWLDTKYMASYGMLTNPDKLRTHIDIKVHALEKGMSIGKVRKGFGKKKAEEVLDDLKLYLKLKGNTTFADECCSIIQKYIAFNEWQDADMSDVKQMLDEYCVRHDIKLLPYGGIYELSHKDIQNGQAAPFDIFSQSRFSCRDFGDTPIDIELIKKALMLCERTPSACNRQSQRIHVYLDGELKDKICKFQGGSKGFSNDFQGAILICEEITGYSSAETNLPYVDGGIYAMNLLYALHFYDIAAIPLTMGRRTNYLIKMMKQMGIPKNEVPVLLIGIGSYKDKWKVAQSHRNDWSTYTTFDK